MFTINGLVHAWKYRYTAAFLPATIQQAFRPGNTAYASLMELDRGIRTFAIPCHLMIDLQGTDQRPWSTDAPTALQQCSCIFMKETSEWMCTQALSAHNQCDHASLRPPISPSQVTDLVVIRVSS